MNPLIEKYEEIYGKKEEEKSEDFYDEYDKLKEVVSKAMSTAGDVVTLGNVGDTVIPTAQVTDSGINLTGDYITTNSIVPNQFVTSMGYTSLTCSQKTITLPNQTSVEQQFNKVMDDVSNKRAHVSSINAEIDQSFTGFGGQIRYTVEIIGTYP
jgi:hypothetical protein